MKVIPVKKVLSFFLCVLLCLCACPSFAFAEVAPDEELPPYPTFVEVPFEGGCLTVLTDGTLVGSKDLSGDIEVPSTLDGITVTSIGREARLGEAGGIVMLPDTVQKVNAMAFLGAKQVLVSPSNPWLCTDEQGNLYSKDHRILYRYDIGGMDTVILPEGLEELADECLPYLPTGLTIILPKTIKRLGDHTLQGHSLKLTVSSNVEEVGNNTFSGSLWENLLTLTADVTSLPSEFFGGFCGEIVVEPGNPRYEVQDGIVYDIWEQAAVFCNRKAKSAAVRAGTLTIGTMAFRKCNSLKALTLPEGLRTIEEDAFEECYNLSELTLPDSVEVLEERALFGCTSLQTVNLPKNLRKIGDFALHFTEFETLELPSGLEEIGTPYEERDDDSWDNPTVFYGSYRTVKIPDSVRYIGSGAFFSRETMSVFLPDREIEIAWDAFKNERDHIAIDNDCRGAIFYGEEGSFAQRYAQENDRIFRPGTPEDYPAGYQDPYPGTPYVDIFDCEDSQRHDIREAYQKGILIGVSPNRFSPEEKLSRGMFLTALYRLAGAPEPRGTSSFADIQPGAYYAKAAAWAQENGVLVGAGRGNMSPHRAITVQEAAVFLHRWYARQKGISEQEFFQEFPAEDWWNEEQRGWHGVADWGAKAYQRMSVWGVVPNSIDDSPTDRISRVDAADILNAYGRALQNQPSDRWVLPGIIGQEP